MRKYALTACKGLMHNINFLVKNGLSLNKASPLHSHENDMLSFFDDDGTHMENECNQLIHCKLPCMSQTHRSSYSNWEFVHSLNAVVEEEDVTMLKKATFFLLLVDESNNVSTTKNLLIYVQFVNIFCHANWKSNL